MVITFFFGSKVIQISKHRHHPDAKAEENKATWVGKYDVQNISFKRTNEGNGGHKLTVNKVFKVKSQGPPDCPKRMCENVLVVYILHITFIPCHKTLSQLQGKATEEQTLCP